MSETFLIEQDIKKLKRKGKASEIVIKDIVNQTRYPESKDKTYRSKYFTQSEGIMLTDFTGANLNYNNNNVTVTADTSDKITGSQSIAIKPTIINGYITATFPFIFNLADMNILGFWVFVEDKVAFDHLDISFTDSATAGSFINNFKNASIMSYVNLNKGWNYIKVLKTDFVQTGTLDWANIKQLSFKFYNLSAKLDGTAPTIKIDSVWKNPIGRPAIILGFDDSGSTFFSTGYPYLKSKGIKGTMNVCQNHTEGGYMTLDQHREIYNNGWDLANHTITHTRLSTLDYNSQKSELEGQLNWLLDNGFPRGAYHCAFPQGDYNDITIQVLKDLNYKTARGCIFGSIGMPTNISDYILNFPTYELDEPNGKGFTYIKPFIDKAISKGSVLSIFTHGIIDGTVTPYSVSLTQFAQIIEYIISLGVEFLTISEYYARIYDSRFNYFDSKVCTTTTRPTASAMIGDTVFDSTLGCTITYKGAGVWVNGIGTTV